MWATKMGMQMAANRVLEKGMDRNVKLRLRLAGMPTLRAGRKKGPGLNRQGCEGGHRRVQGMSAVETLYALPFVLLLGLGVVQFAAVFHAKHMLNHALDEAVRQGSMEHASERSILSGLAAGMAPWLYGGSNIVEKMANEKRALAQVMAERATGLLVLMQHSPTLESFSDWGQPALDARGERIRGQDEIPNDNLDNRGDKTKPASGVAGSSLGDPVGRTSGQTLADANLLRLEMHYGVRLGVPVVGRIVLRTLIGINGCNTPAGIARSAGEAVDVCRFYLAGRIPVSVASTTRMMSTARRSKLLRAALPGSGRASAGAGAGVLTPQSSTGGAQGVPAPGRGQPAGGGRGAAAGNADADSSPEVRPSGGDRLNLPWERSGADNKPAMSSAADSAEGKPLLADADDAAPHPLVCTAEEKPAG